MEDLNQFRKGKEHKDVYDILNENFADDEKNAWNDDLAENANMAEEEYENYYENDDFNYDWDGDRENITSDEEWSSGSNDYDIPTSEVITDYKKLRRQ